MKIGALPTLGGKFFYGWTIVLACNLVACITWGVTVFNQGVFIAHYVSAYGWSLAALSLGGVIFQITSGLTAIPVGQLVDRWGPRPVLVIGALTIVVSLLMFASVRALWQAYAAFAILGLGYCCIHTITLGKIISRWFFKQRARAMAAATYGAGVGGALLVPLNAYLISAHGLSVACLVLAMLTLLLIVPLAVWVIRDRPETLGLQPDGEPAPSEVESADQVNDDAETWPIGDAMRTLAFWGIAISFSLAMLAQSAFLFHQVSFLQAKLGLIAAATVVSVTTMTALVGRTLFVVYGDRFAPGVWALVMFVVQALGFVVLANADERAALVVGSVLFGFTMSVIVTLQPLATASCFGRESFGRIYGPIYSVIRAGSAIGPAIIGVLVDATGGYAAAWYTLAASVVIGMLFVPFFSRPPRLK